MIRWNLYLFGAWGEFEGDIADADGEDDMPMGGGTPSSFFGGTEELFGGDFLLQVLLFWCWLRLFWLTKQPLHVLQVKGFGLHLPPLEIMCLVNLTG